MRAAVPVIPEEEPFARLLDGFNPKVFQQLVDFFFDGLQGDEARRGRLGRRRSPTVFRRRLPIFLQPGHKHLYGERN